MDLVILPNASSVDKGAVCLDGSPPAIYMSKANIAAHPGAANKWVLYFKGGGWCYDVDSCAARGEGLIGSSSHLAESQPTFGYGGGPLGKDPRLNPSWANFNHGQ